MLKNIVADPLDDKEIRHYLPNAKIMTYKELDRYHNDISKLLPNNRDYAILLYENSPMNGHWVAVLRDGDKIEHFDSYGVKPDAELKWVDCGMRQMVGSGTPLLTNMYDDWIQQGGRVVYNPIEYQQQGSKINTCGRHAINRIETHMKQHYDLDKYKKYMNNLRRQSGLSYDEIVSKKYPINN